MSSPSRAPATRPGLAAALILAVGLAGPSAGQEPGPRIEETSTRATALLAEHCHTCHGPEKHKGGLRLDRPEDALLGGDSGPALVAGNPDASLLLERVSDELDRMPPKGPALEPEEIGLLRRWIETGARWPEVDADDAQPERRPSDHWAYRSPSRPAVPADPDAWSHDPVDAFVRARLAAADLAPAPEADRETLVRRVSLDLLGLPPSPEEVAAFLADDAPGAYERLVDRLLASPHYGEHQARHWLDLARYADSHGYTVDGARSIWPWRDWVVGALNDDVPFDRFTVLQLAGDLLPDAMDADRIATGFHRNTMVNQEGGADDEEFRVAALFDRVDTTASVWLGTTLACARCHTHKFDPFTQREYFSLLAFFDQTADRGVSAAPALQAPSAAERATLAEIEGRIAALEAELARPSPALDASRAAWERSLAAGGPRWVVPEIVRTLTTNEVRLAPDEDGVLVAGGADPDRATYTVQLDTELERVTALRLEVFADPDLPSGGPGRADNGNFVLTRLRVDVAPRSDLSARQVVRIVGPTADHEQHLSRTSHWPVAGTLVDEPRTGWAILPEAGRDHLAIFPFEEALEEPGGMRLTVAIEQDYGSRHTIGRLRLSVTDAAPPLRTEALPDDLRTILERAEHERSDAECARLAAYHRDIAPELDPLRAEIAALKAERPVPPTSLVLRAVGEPRTTHLLRRGSFLDPGEVVTPGVPAVLPPLENDGGREPTRLDLARWLVSTENPLTARVVVNRAWQRFFGTGLVATENDFGTRGASPSHPALLDWLAVDFMEGGWSLKRLHRTIVTSATYRQASRTRPELLERDPQNRLLARQSRLRVPAEVIRDSALVASGLLARDLGGRPVYPPQPEGVFRFTQTAKTWMTSEDTDRYRRSLYTWRWRTSLYPFYATFDAPPGDVACTRRNRSNTPLQALTMANDPMVVELAAGLAQRALAEPAADDRARLGRMFRRALARGPEERELDRLAAFLERQLAAFAAAPEEAERAVSLAPEAPLEGAPFNPVRLAAWTATARVIFNLDEFLTRG